MEMICIMVVSPFDRRISRGHFIASIGGKVNQAGRESGSFGIKNIPICIGMPEKRWRSYFFFAFGFFLFRCWALLPFAIERIMRGYTPHEEQYSMDLGR
jgi:hypothetical protein